MNISYNVNIYGDWIKWYVPGISNHDVKFVSNKAAKLHKWADKMGGCVDNFRMKKHGCFSDTEKYDKALAAGCCGFVDVEITNPYTGNTFTIGFNYGH